MVISLIGSLFNLTKNIHEKSTVADSLKSDHYCIKSYFNVSVAKPSTLFMSVGNMANIDRLSFIAELSSA